jgi:hypothetical protein
MARRKWHLTDPLVAERLLVAQAHAALRALAVNVALPGRLRTEAAHIALRLGRLGRDLAMEARRLPPTEPTPEEGA